MPTAIAPWEKDLADVARARLDAMDHELSALRARTLELAEQTRWRSTAFARFTERTAALSDDLLRIDAEAQDLSYDLRRATGFVGGGSGV